MSSPWQNPRGLLSPGTDIRDALPVLVQNAFSQDATIDLYAMPTPRRAQTRLRDSEPAQPLIEAARTRRHEHGIPFWDALLSTAVERGPDIPDEIALSALYHQDVKTSGRRLRFKATSLDRQTIDHEIGQLQEREFLMVRSASLEEPGLHLPMLDLHISSDGAAAEGAARKLLAHLGEPGYLFNSGRSFHFYGSRTIPWAEMALFLARAQLLSPVVDTRWVAHQLIEQCAALRISHGRERQQMPQLVAAVNTDSGGARW